MRLRVYAKWSAGYSVPNREVIEGVERWETTADNALLVVHMAGPKAPDIIYVVANLVRWEAVVDDE